MDIYTFVDYHYILFIVLIIIIVLVYKYYNTKPNSRQYLDKYLLETVKKQKDIVLSCKPKIWIHIDREINSREWESFSTKNTRKLNQPYLYLTLETILNHCSSSFDIYLITDDSFTEILPNWNIDMGKISYPIKDKIRMKGMMEILYHYGGMVLPIHFICKENLIEMYKKYIDEGIFVSEMPIFRNNRMEFSESNKIMGAKKGNTILNEYILWFQENISNDYTAESIFKDEERTWLSKNVTNMIPAKYIGTQDENGEMIGVEKLMSTEIINFYSKAYGIYIPRNELLTRLKYNWFCQLKEEEVIHSKTNIAFLLQ